LQPDPRRPNKEGDSTLELGELEQLCVNNDAEISYDVSYQNSSCITQDNSFMLVFYSTDGFHHKRDFQENMECEIYVTIAF